MEAHDITNKVTGLFPNQQMKSLALIVVFWATCSVLAVDDELSLSMFTFYM